MTLLACYISISLLLICYYRNAEDRARYPNQMTYPMPPEMGEMSDATNLHGLYPSGGGVGTGWGDDPTGTGGGTGQSGYG